MAILLTMSSGVSAVTRITSGNTLLGANGVEVNHVLYDVRFQDGTCISLYSGCDQASDFVFPANSFDANSASNALNEQVFIDIGSQLWDSSSAFAPSGCTFVNSCSIITPYGISGSNVLSTTFVNWYVATNTDFSRINTPSARSTFTTIGSTSGTMAVWSLAAPPVTPVPEPETYALLLAGLGIVAFAARRAKVRGAS